MRPTSTLPGGKCLILFVLFYSVLFSLGCDPQSRSGTTQSNQVEIMHPSDSDISQVAQQGLASFLPKIPLGKEADYGFTNREQFSRVTLGSPIRMHAIDKATVETGQKFNLSQIRPLNQWRIPIMDDQSPVALLTVAYHKGKLKTVSLGGAGLAAELFGQTEGLVTKAGTQTTYLLRIHTMQLDFLEIHSAEGNQVRFAPLRSAATAVRGLISRSSDTLLTENDLGELFESAIATGGVQ